MLYYVSQGIYEAVELDGVLPPPSRLVDPVFGPIGLSPLEREPTLGVYTMLYFHCFSPSAVHVQRYR
jgi:hypothetical protein